VKNRINALSVRCNSRRVRTLKTMNGSTQVSDPTSAKSAIRHLQDIRHFGTTGGYIQVRNRTGVMFAVQHLTRLRISRITPKSTQEKNPIVVTSVMSDSLTVLLLKGTVAYMRNMVELALTPQIMQHLLIRILQQMLSIIMLVQILQQILGVNPSSRASHQQLMSSTSVRLVVL